MEGCTGIMSHLSDGRKLPRDTMKLVNISDVTAVIVIGQIRGVAASTDPW